MIRFASLLVAVGLASVAFAEDAFEYPPLDQPVNTWVKRSPLPGGPPSPRLGYETSMAYDPVAKKVIRWAGHNQGGGGEQNAETWTFDPRTGSWELKQPNRRPPGACCNQQNVFDLCAHRFIRFPAFSGSHGWQWFREVYLNNTSVWTYDLKQNTWREMRPLPEPRVRPLRCAAWDSDLEVVVLFGGEGGHDGTFIYDPYTNTWTDMNPPAEPAPRSGGNMVYDAKHKLHILFGSQFSDDPHTWAYDPRKNEWRDMKPAVMPPTNRNDPAMCYDEASGKVVAVLRAVTKQGDNGEPTEGRLETWAYDTGANTWAKVCDGPEGFGARNRVLTYLPDLNLCLLESVTRPDRDRGTDREQQVWTLRLAEKQKDTKPGAGAPTPPGEVTMRPWGDGVKLSWAATPSEGESRLTYEVYRADVDPDDEQPWAAAFKRVGRANAVSGDNDSFQDSGLEEGWAYRYHVVSVDTRGRRSAPSATMRTRPRAPEPPIVSVSSTSAVTLQWQPQEQPTGIRGYHVERAPVEVLSTDQLARLKRDEVQREQPSVGAIVKIGPFKRLTEQPVGYYVFSDEKLDLSQPTRVTKGAIYDRPFHSEQLNEEGEPYRYGVYAYRLIAVNIQGVESGPSPYALTIPSAPQHVVSREAGTSCEVKWSVNAENHLRGYRVYRMDQRFSSKEHAIVRPINEEPTGKILLTDEQAGEHTRRYYVVAVDAIGQEGFPSSPTWYRREWQRFYEPFVGEWHQ